MYPLPKPAERDLQYRVTAYSHNEICAAVDEVNTAYKALCDACGRFEAQFKARYFSHVGVFHITDKNKIDDDYARLAKLREQVARLDEPHMGNGVGYSRSGGSQECYPVAKWRALTRRYQTATGKMLKELASQ